MSLDELKTEITEIEQRIFMPAKYLSQDFVYFHEVCNEYPNTYNNFHYFIDRMKFAVTVSLILNLSKLYYSEEKYSLRKLFNKMRVGYKNSELNTLLPEMDFMELAQSVDDDYEKFTLAKIKKLRDCYYAHLDRSKPDPEEVIVNSTEINELINKAETILQTINSKYFNTSVDYDLTNAELGYDIFKRVDEWQQYWSKHGFIKTYS